MVGEGVAALRMLSKGHSGSGLKQSNLSGWMGRKTTVALGKMRLKRQWLRVGAFFAESNV